MPRLQHLGQLEEYKTQAADARDALRPPDAGTADWARRAEPVTVDQIDAADSPRLPTGIGEFDRILGGGAGGSALLSLLRMARG